MLLLFIVPDISTRNKCFLFCPKAFKTHFTHASPMIVVVV